MQRQHQGYTIKAVCEARGISRAYVYILLGAGKLKAVKDGRRTIITADSFDAYFGALPAAEFRSRAAA